MGGRVRLRTACILFALGVLLGAVGGVLVWRTGREPPTGWEVAREVVERFQLSYEGQTHDPLDSSEVLAKFAVDWVFKSYRLQIEVGGWRFRISNATEAVGDDDRVFAKFSTIGSRGTHDYFVVGSPISWISRLRFRLSPGRASTRPLLGSVGSCR